MDVTEARRAAGLADAPTVRYEGLSAVFDVLISPGVVAAACDPVLGPFRTGPGRPARRLLDVEPVTRIDVLDLSRPDDQRYGLWFDDVVHLTSPTLPQVLDRLSDRFNAHVLASAREFLLVHAGSVVAPEGGAVVLAAGSGAGKSSLTAALVQEGFGYLSDEFAAIDPVHGLVHGYPKPLTLKRGSWPLFPDVATVPSEGAEGEWHVRPGELGGAQAAGSAAIRYVVLPQWRRGATTEITPLSRAQAVVALGEHALGTFFYGARGVDLLARVSREVVAARVVYDSLQEGVAAVRSLVAASHQSPGDAAT